MVAKKDKIGSKLPLHRRPISIPAPLLKDKLLYDHLKAYDRGYSSEFGIEPIKSVEFLAQAPDCFTVRRLKEFIVKEYSIRLKACRTTKMKQNVSIVFAGIENVKIGSYDFSQDDVYVPKSRLAKIINMPIGSELCLEKNHTHMGQSLEHTF